MAFKDITDWLAGVKAESDNPKEIELTSYAYETPEFNGPHIKVDSNEMREKFSNENINPNIKVLTYDNSGEHRISENNVRDELKEIYEMNKGNVEENLQDAESDYKSTWAKNWYVVPRNFSGRNTQMNRTSISGGMMTYLWAGASIISEAIQEDPKLDEGVLIKGMGLALLEGVRNLQKYVAKSNIKSAQKDKNVVDNIDKAYERSGEWGKRKGIYLQEVPDARQVYDAVKQEEPKISKSENQDLNYFATTFKTEKFNDQVEEAYKNFEKPHGFSSG